MAPLGKEETQTGLTALRSGKLDGMFVRLVKCDHAGRGLLVISAVPAKEHPASDKPNTEFKSASRAPCKLLTIRVPPDATQSRRAFLAEASIAVARFLLSAVWCT